MFAAPIDASVEGSHLEGMMRHCDHIAEGDTVVIYLSYGNMHTITVTRGLTLASKFGALRHEFLIGKAYGSRVEATAGYVYVLRATPELWTCSMPHRTQIIYTPDISAIIAQLEIRPGSRVCESGTGSGSMTHALLRCVAPTGHIFTYDIDESRVAAIGNDAVRHGFDGLLTVGLLDVCVKGFGEELNDSIDAVVLDLPSPWLCLPHVLRALSSTRVCRLATFSPCVEQVSRTVVAMRRHGCVHIDTVEVVPVTYKTQSVQPTDLLRQEATSTAQLLAVTAPDTQPTHTSYLTFATVLRRA